MMENSRETKLGVWQGKLLAGTAVCFLVSVYLVTQWCFGPFREFTTKRLMVVFTHYFVMCSVWGVLTIPIQSVVNRLGFDRNRIVRTIVVYLLIGIAFACVFFVLTRIPLRAIGYLAYGFARSGGITWFEALASLNSGLVVFTIIVGACLAVGYLQKQQDNELKTSKLETQLTKANLNALKSQLQPHFLFNSLNTIASLIRQNPEAAEEMVVQLGDLLRSTLENVKHDEVTVREELEFLWRYVEIEKLRFGDRLVIDHRIDPDVYDAMVPNLLLQPLVENAIRHGVAKVSRPSIVTISAQREGSQLRLAVSDTGPGRSERAKTQVGIGLENTTERLRHLYGNRYRIIAKNRSPDAGFCVSIEIPCHFVPVAESME